MATPQKPRAVPDMAPNSYEAEQAALGAILADNALLVDVRAFLAPADYFYKKHEWIYEAMLALDSRREPIDLVTTLEELRRANRVVDFPDAEAYLGLLPQYVPDPDVGLVYAHIVERAAYRRRILAFSEATAKLSWDEERDTIQIINEIEAEWRGIRDGLVQEGTQSLKEIASLVYDEVMDGNSTFVPTGYEDLDELLSGGFHPGTHNVLCGRPGMGKTTLAINIARNVAFRHNLPVIIFSMEMTKKKLVEWLIAGQMKFPASDFWKIRRGNDPALESRFVDAMDWVSRLPIFINDASGTTPPQMTAYINAIVRAEGSCGLVIVDHINRARTGIQKLDYGDSAYGRVSLLAQEYKNVAKDTMVPVLSVAQLSRAVEQRGDKHPMLSDLRESGRVEEEADLVLGMYRQSYYDSSAADTMTTEIATLKNREGPQGKACVQALFTHSRFYNTAWQGDKPNGINWPAENRLDGTAGVVVKKGEL